MNGVPSRGTLMRRAAIASVAAALLLLVAKVWAHAETGSVAILGSLADTGLDLIASLVTFFAVRVAAEPADREHRFGHGKAEAISALFQVMLIGISALAVAVQAVRRLIDPQPVAAPEAGIGVSLFAILVTLLLVVYQRRIARATQSLAIETDRLHYQSDLALNVAVIAALVLAGFGLEGADPVFGLAIAAWFAWTAYGGGRRAVDMLMDREWPELQRQQLLNMVAIMPDVHGVHELRTRRAGDQDFVQFHMWVDPDLTVAEAHEISDRVEAAVLKAYPGTELLIHVDPRGHMDDSEVEEDHFCQIDPEAQLPSAT
jgi:ferrous-iron efflux pump FieF|tara:strand:+ start:112828 stop:113775 length:948 start_codon:yes stop_codon:yes gene_type:complete